MALITQSDLEARLGRTLTTAESNAFPLINLANQKYLEKYIGSSLEDVEPSTRYYDGGMQHLGIDPATDITAINVVDDDSIVTDTIDTTDYTVEPTSKTIKTQIRFRSRYFPRGINNVRVTAKFSIYDDSDLLAIVKNALLEALYAEFKNSSNEFHKESIEGYSVEYARVETRDILNQVKYLFPQII